MVHQVKGSNFFAGQVKMLMLERDSVIIAYGFLFLSSVISVVYGCAAWAADDAV